MLEKQCKYAIILTLFSFCIIIYFMGNESQMGILRFIPLLSYLFNATISLMIFTLKGIKKDKFTFLLFAFSIIMILGAILKPNKELSILMNLLMPIYWITSYFIVSHITKHINSIKKINDRIFIVFLVFSTLVCYALITSNIKTSLEDVLVGSNIIFFVLLLLPWIAILETKRKWIGVITITILTILSIKRSAIIIIMGALLILLFDRNHGQKGKSTRILLGTIAVIGIILIGIPDTPLDNVLTRFEALEEDGGNGRLDIYNDVINAFSKQSTLNQFFGSGYRAVQNELFKNYNYNIYISAHNDFLEVLFDYGYIGFLFYILLHIKIIKRIIMLYRSKNAYFSAYLISYFEFLIMSSVSHLIIYPSYFLFLVAFWAYSENRFKTRNLQII